MLGAVARFAGSKLLSAAKGGMKLGSALGKRTIRNLGPMDPGMVTGMVAPDLIFGAMYGAATPGDLTDKIVAGAGSTIGGVVGGVGLRGAIGVKNPGLGMAIDFAGSMGGDMAGQAASDQILRAKDKLSGGLGLSPFERAQLEQEQMLRQQVEAEVRRDIYNQMVSGKFNQGF